jgi:hypothetical protein
MLKDLHLLAGNLRALDATDQFLALAAEHAATDDLDPAAAEPLIWQRSPSNRG